MKGYGQSLSQYSEAPVVEPVNRLIRGIGSSGVALTVVSHGGIPRRLTVRRGDIPRVSDGPEPSTWDRKERIMTYRLTDRTATQGAVQQLLGVSAYLRNGELGDNLIELISMRASQINGCAFCLALHAKALRESGEREDRLAVLAAWRETDWFTNRERAALAWTEAVTTLENREVPAEVFEQARAEFSERELADLTLAVIVINGWNRLNVAFHNPPVAYTIDAREGVAAD
jgi:AhpD family alkylhydroperoxidase